MKPITAGFMGLNIKEETEGVEISHLGQEFISIFFFYLYLFSLSLL